MLDHVKPIYIVYGIDIQVSSSNVFKDPHRFKASLAWRADSPFG